MVNRYDTPVQLDFINTYVPIPFEQLYNLGKAANDRVDKALEDFTTSMDKFGEFYSRSKVDMQRWYDATIGKQMPLIDQMAKNPELIKDKAFQAQLKSSIANVDRALLSELKQGAKNFDEFKKMEQQLMLSGKGNPFWHNRDFSNYDTVKQGLFDETPIPYISVNDMVHPYVDNLKASEMDSRGGYLYHGVSPERTKAQVEANITEILSTPQAAMHIKTMTDAGMDKATAVNTFINQVYRAAEEAAWVDRAGADPYSLKAYEKTLTTQPTGAQSRIMEHEADLGLKQLRALGITAESSEEDIRKAYEDVYKDALRGGKEGMKKLKASQTTRIGSEAYMMVDPLFDESSAVKAKVGSKGVMNYIPLDASAMYGAVALNDDGIPVAEISKEFLLNNEKSLVKVLGNFYDGSDTRKKLAEKVINEYPNIINEFVNSVDGAFLPNGTISSYRRINNPDGYPYQQSTLVYGKLLIPESTVDEVTEKIANTAGLDASDVKTILFKDGIGGKHKIGKKIDKDDIKFGDKADVGATEDYYEINLGYPFDNEANRKSFEANYAKDVYGSEKSYKGNATHLSTSYNSNM